jgi:hypothetical protein
MCPPEAGVPSTRPTGIWPIAAPEAWRYTAFGYKVIEGVSYAVDVGVSADASGVGNSVSMRAPNGHERTTDLFTDRPPPVATADSCIESAAGPIALTSSGPVIHVGEYAPSATATTDPGALKPNSR